MLEELERALRTLRESREVAETLKRLVEAHNSLTTRSMGLEGRLERLEQRLAVAEKSGETELAALREQVARLSWPTEEDGRAITPVPYAPPLPADYRERAMIGEVLGGGTLSKVAERHGLGVAALHNRVHSWAERRWKARLSLSSIRYHARNDHALQAL